MPQHMLRSLLLQTVMLSWTCTLLAQSEPRPSDYLALQKGNVWEYAVAHEVDGEQVSPTTIRFTILDRLPGPGAFTDYVVSVDFYDDGQAIRRTSCQFRTDGNDPFFVGTNPLNRVDCAFQSPFMAADVEMDTRTTSVHISDSVFQTPYVGVYESFWSTPSGESGYISNHFAPGLGLYRYENKRAPAILDLTSKQTSWIGELVFARIDGVEYGASRVSQHPDVRDDGAPY